jgi:hypothetical protein
MTGVLRFTKDGLFSGSNHVIEHDVTSEVLSQFYCFVQDEVDELCYEFGITNDGAEQGKLANMV